MEGTSYLMKHLWLLLGIMALAVLVGCDSPSNKPSTPTIGLLATPTSILQILPSRTPTGASNSGGGINPPPPAPGSTSDPDLTVAVLEPTTTATYLRILTPTIAPADAVTATLAAELQGTAIAGVEATSTPDTNGMSPFAGIDGIAVLRLGHMPVNGEFWLAYSTGSRRLDQVAVQKHFVVAFRHANNKWEEISRIELDNPDYMSDGSITQIDIEPSHAWLSVDSGVGAHGGCYDLLSFDGKALRNEVSGCASSPGAGFVEDLDGDGKGEVVLDATDNYVFCYACGVKRINFNVLRWDGEDLKAIQVSDMPGDAPAEVKQLNDQAVDLFRHELMKDALDKINKAEAISSGDPIVKWNHVIIKLHADARQQHVAESNYPLLTNIFYGDYAAAVDVLRNYTVDQVMSRADKSPLVIGTVAEENADLLVSYITSTATLALEAQPDLASAYYLRGWACYLEDNKDAEAKADLQSAATLNPSDPLFIESLAKLNR